ncbi:hypothetical protein D3C87_98120 [compost metagenome]
MKLFINLLSFALIFSFTSCGSGSQSPNVRNQFTENSPEPEVEKEKSPEELRTELKASEENSPMQYLFCGGVRMIPQEIKTRNAGFFRDAEYEPDGAIFKGAIHNNATLGRFKDAKIKILFYSRTSTLIEEKSHTIYEYLEPQSSTNFSFKMDSYPEEYENFRVELVSASVAGQ